MAGKKGRSGRPRKATALHIAEGTHRHNEHGDIGDAVLATGCPEKPHFASIAASDHWDEVVPQLVSLGVAAQVDRSHLIAMCELWGLYRSAYDIAESHPTDKDARIAVSTYFTKWESAAARVGMNPSDRSRLKIDKPKSTGIEARKRG